MRGLREPLFRPQRCGNHANWSLAWLVQSTLAVLVDCVHPLHSVAVKLLSVFVGPAGREVKSLLRQSDEGRGDGAAV